ncbi:MAG: CheR family methyltransferase, partial [Bdellovibrionota bacterium]
MSNHAIKAKQTCHGPLGGTSDGGTIQVSDQSIAFVSELVSKITGVQLGTHQTAMVSSRLLKHLLDLGLSDQEYADFFSKNQKSETQALISLLTTHHSYFFREYSQFEYLESVTLPALIKIARQREDRTIRLWCAACSRGQEVYSLSMALNRFLAEKAPDLRYKIWGTDVDEKSVQLAQNGVYLKEEMKEIPMAYLGNHWAPGTGEISHFVKAKKSIKEACSFSVLNLLEMSAKRLSQSFDIIFCRNVFIYFSSQQIEKVAGEFIKLLTPEGLLFVGISESLRSLGLPIQSLGPSIYANAKRSVHPSAFPSKCELSLIRVLCVDDSPSILLLLKKILTNEFGFEIVGTAANGLEA